MYIILKLHIHKNGKLLLGLKTIVTVGDGLGCIAYERTENTAL